MRYLRKTVLCNWLSNLLRYGNIVLAKFTIIDYSTQMQPPLKKQRIQRKESERASVAYERTIKEIDQFFGLVELYRSSASELLSEQKILMQRALIQSICLIGDTLTWLREGKYGRDFTEMPPKLKKLAADFKDPDLKKIIDLRNACTHDFLYATEQEQSILLQDLESLEFLGENVNLLDQAMKTIKETMGNQKKDVGDLFFEGEISTPDHKALDLPQYSYALLREMALFEWALDHQEDLKKLLGETGFERALNFCIKSLCQIYNEYTKNTMVCDLMDSVLAQRVDLGFAYAVLAHAQDLRNYLAHPNMHSLETTAKRERDRFIDKRKVISDLFKAIIPKPSQQAHLATSEAIHSDPSINTQQSEASTSPSTMLFSLEAVQASGGILPHEESERSILIVMPDLENVSEHASSSDHEEQGKGLVGDYGSEDSSNESPRSDRP